MALVLNFLGGFAVPHKKKRRPSASRKLKLVMLVCLGLVTVLVIGAGVLIQQERTSRANAEAASFTPKPIPTNDLTNRVRVVVVGDSYTSGSAEGGKGSNAWPMLVEQRLKADDLNVSIAPFGLGGSGYLATGSSGKTFGDAAETNVAETTDVVVVFGSLNDGGQNPSEVRAAATDLYAMVADRAPDAQLIIVGPTAPHGELTASAENTYQAVMAAAEATDATVIDPISEEWFFDGGLIGSDGVHPVDEGHDFMADKLAPVIREAVTVAVAG